MPPQPAPAIAPLGLGASIEPGDHRLERRAVGADVDATILTSDPSAHSIRSDIPGLSVQREQVGVRRKRPGDQHAGAPGRIGRARGTATEQAAG